ncbi:uncharacterized protein LOC144120821 [Amblyomma americanum]
MDLSVAQSILLLEEYYLLENKKLLMSSTPATSTVSVLADGRAGALPPDFSPQQLLLLEEYYLLQKRRILLSAPVPRRWWTRPIWQNRKEESVFYTVMPLLMSGDPEYFKKYYRMTPEKFEELHSLLEEHLTKAYVVREPLPLRARLAITLRWQQLKNGRKLPEVSRKNATCQIVLGTYSIALMAVANCYSKYVMVDVGTYGRQSDRALSACRGLASVLKEVVLGSLDQNTCQAHRQQHPMCLWEMKRSSFGRIFSGLILAGVKAKKKESSTTGSAEQGGAWKILLGLWCRGFASFNAASTFCQAMPTML